MAAYKQIAKDYEEIGKVHQEINARVKAQTVKTEKKTDMGFW